MLIRAVEKRRARLAGLELIRAGRLSKAFVSDRTARTLWLSGAHRRNSIKADSKVLLADGLRSGLGKRISELVWPDGQPAARAAMAEALEQLGADYERQVVIVQPQLTKHAVTSAREKPTTGEAARLRQLERSSSRPVPVGTRARAWS